MRRDFTGLAYEGSGRRVLVRAVLPLAALLVVTVGVVDVATSAPAPGSTRAKLDRSLATAFAHVYRLQTRELHRPEVTEAQLPTLLECALSAGGDFLLVLERHS